MSQVQIPRMGDYLIDTRERCVNGDSSMVILTPRESIFCRDSCIVFYIVFVIVGFGLFTIIGFLINKNK